jgi:hypothetical protein
MFEKCIACNRIGESCVPNLMLLSFPELLKWCAKRQKHLDWTNNDLADKSKVPVSTINRIKGGDYLDCKYSTIKNILITLIGGTSDEFSCTEQVEREMKQKEQLEQQAAQFAVTQTENERLKNILSKIDDQHRGDIRIIKAEYQEQISFLKDELKFLREELESRRISKR